MRDRGCRPAQSFAVLPGVGQAGASSLPQDLPFELGEDGQQPRHRSTGRRSQVQRLGQRHEAHAEMLQFLKGCQQIRYRPAPAVQPPYQHDIDLAAACGLQQFLTSFSLGRTGADLTDVARQWSSPAGRHTPAWRDSAWTASADRWWKRGRTGRRGTFSPASVAWPKTLSDFAFGKARLAAISECHPSMAAVDPFRPGRTHHITRRRAWPAAPVSRGSSRASTPTGFASTPRRAAATR